MLFLPLIDAQSTNAQSLNVREIVLRLDSGHFDCTLLYQNEPDSRLLNRENLTLRKLPSRRKTASILAEMLREHDLIAYLDYSPASYLFLHSPRALRRRTKAIFHAEAPVAQIVNPPRLLRFLFHGVFPRCDFYTGITEYVARDIEAQAGKSARHILPVGVDTKLFIPPTQRSHSTPVVLFCGTLIERKGPQYVVEAAARYPSARFRIVGSGRGGYEEVLRKKITADGLQNVTLEGPKSQPELLEIMQQSDIFMLPSRLEGIPKVSLEAAATGLPSIVFRDYQTPSVLDGITGFQVQTTEEMMQALERLISNGELRQQMGDAARKHSLQFDWDIVSRVWQNAYLEIADSRSM